MGKRLIIAGTGSGVGKTTITIGIMSALKKKGLTVQGFKCGPDYIDPSYHTAVTERSSRNLDSWMLEEAVLKDIFVRASHTADISIIEGVMGFLDGKDPKSNKGSTADISKIIQSPVVLVVNCASMARSAAAIVKGFQVLAKGANVVAVIANKVGSEGHFQIVKTAIEQECDVPVVGYLKKNIDINIPERHLGLIPSIERGELDPFFDKLGDLILETVNVDKLIELSQATELQVDVSQSLFQETKEKSVRIAVAKDAAFNFYYQENLELLEAKGAELIYFSPLKGEVLPNSVDGLYIGGGFPEEYAKQLSKAEEVNKSITTMIKKGLPTLAECGGFMYLTEGIQSTDETFFKMLGVIPGKVIMQKKLVALGYREINGLQGNFLFKNKLCAKGHEFHYSTYENKHEIPYAYETKGRKGIKREGYMTENLVAGYTHFHFASCPEMVDAWIHKMYSWKKLNLKRA